MKKNQRIILMLGSLFIAATFVIIFGTQKEILPVGSPLPGIKFTSPNDSGFVHSSKRPLMVVFFRPDCPHCQYELEVLNKRIDQLKNSDIYFITTDKNFLKDSLLNSQTNLINSQNVTFGCVSGSSYKQQFGIAATPAFFFFDEQGKLTGKIIGETKFEKIRSELNNKLTIN